MEDQREQHTYEVLDLGPPLGRRRAEDDVAPALSDETAPAEVMALGDIAGSVARSAPSPRWQRWTIMASVFLAGIAAGGYGWYARTEAVQAANVEVIGVDLRGQEVPNNQQSDLFAQVHNLGPRDVTITDLRLPGEPDPTGNQIREVTVPAGGTRIVATRGTIDCESDLPDALEAEVRTEAGTASVSVPLASGTTLELYFSPLCDRSDEQIRDVESSCSATRWIR